MTGAEMDLATAMNEVAELHNNQRYPITTRKRQAIAIVLKAALDGEKLRKLAEAKYDEDRK